MASIMGLWDLLRPPPPPAARCPRRRTIMQDRYDAMVATMKETYGFKVRRWRSSTSGCAWELRDKHGVVTRMLESPYPRGPVSCAIFLHEVGHHAIGFRAHRLRCMEEMMAWAWAISAMEANGFNVTARVLRRRDDALRYAVAKAMRRGLKHLPVELAKWAS